MAVAYNNLGFTHARAGDLEAAHRSFVSAGGEAAAQKNLDVANRLYRPQKPEKPVRSGVKPRARRKESP